MWVEITHADGDALIGTLVNHPFDMPQIRHGDIVKFRRSDVIDLQWADDRAVQPPPAPKLRSYWDRCLVDQAVLEEGAKVHFLYREEPDMTEPDDRDPDSGWRIRGDYRHLSDEEIGNRKLEYIAIGKVLNEDDSWLHLIDMPVGSAFIRDWSTGAFVEEQRDDD